jgi:hypothetical protein
VSHSIVWGSVTDLDTLATCAQVLSSNVAVPDCTSVGGNLNVAPQFVDAVSGDYRLLPASPLVEHASAGLSPADFTGVPCQDLDGRPRLLDAEGDGLAVGDLGAYELPRQATVPGEVTGLQFTDQTTLEWDAEAAAATYDVFRGEAPLAFCPDLILLQSGSSATTLTDGDDPPLGGIFLYVIQALDALGDGGTLGSGQCAERSRPELCGSP